MADDENSAIDKIINNKMDEWNQRTEDFLSSDNMTPTEGGAPTSTQTENKPSQSQENPEKTENNNPPQPEPENNFNSSKPSDVEVVYDGTSRAYADDIQIKQPAPSKKDKSYPKPPERGKAPKVAGGKDIMEVAWNEFWALCDSVIDGAVDLTFDFITAVLYATPPKSTETVKKEIDIMAIGNKLHNEKMEKVDEILKFTKDICAEINQNLLNELQGEKKQWTLLKEEPAIFKTLVEAKKKATADPASPEAKKIENWESMPQILDKLAENFKKIVTIADRMATLEEYTHPCIENKEQEIKAAQKQYENDPQKLKETLDEIEKSYKNPEQKIKKNLSKRQTIRTEELIKNIDKIRDKYADTPEKENEVIRKYMESISTSFRVVHNDVYTQMYINKNDGSKAKKKAQQSISAMNDSINGFVVDGKPLRDYDPVPKDKLSNINMEKFSKLDTLVLIKQIVMSR
ncbi:MAG: hypothetical protein NC218_02885 [Acetobacter sp.]|nr:hypothetical protein [Acetobacter sp.]